ncbi:MAG: hypothetical protein KKF50_05435 [Nanoarchaeota archaeon]|nr:hypothetical protein [Nanoarchaeota archaeon]
MSNEEMKKQIWVILKIFGSIQSPDEGKREPLQMAIQAKGNIQRNQDTLQDSIDLLRILVKYLVLDIESSNRENAYLRKMLEK